MNRVFLFILPWVLFSLILLIIWNSFPSSKNDSNLNALDSATSVFFFPLVSLHVTLSVFSSGTFPGPAHRACLRTVMWEEVKHVWGWGAPLSRALDPVPSPDPPRPTLWHRHTFEQLCNCPSILAHCISWHVQHLGMKQVHRSRPMPLELHWQCFSAGLLLIICRAEPCHGGPGRTSHPSCVTVHVIATPLCLSLGKGGSREPFISIPDCTSKPSLCGWS